MKIFNISEFKRIEIEFNEIFCFLKEKNMVATKVEDLGWFIYLVNLDISEN